MTMKKGFTLIEILATILIIGLILAIIVPNLIKLSSNIQEREYEAQKKLIGIAADQYKKDHPTLFTSANIVGIKVDQLIEFNYLESDAALNEKGCTSQHGCIINLKNGSMIKYLNNQCICMNKLRSSEFCDSSNCS